MTADKGAKPGPVSHWGARACSAVGLVVCLILKVSCQQKVIVLSSSGCERRGQYIRRLKLLFATAVPEWMEFLETRSKTKATYLARLHAF